MERRDFNKLAAIGFLMLARSCRPKAVVELETTETVTASTATPPVEASKTAKPRPSVTPVKTSLEWGVFTGHGTEDVEKVEQVVGKRTNLLTTFVGWEGDGVIGDEVIDYAKENKKKLLVFWEAYEPGKVAREDTKYACESISAGKFDGYIKRFSKNLKDSGIPAVLFPFPEVNGDWTAQSLAFERNKGKFVDTYRHVSSFFAEVPKVRMGLALNNQSIPNEKGNQLDDYFPGKRWVQVAGIDGFNFGPPNEPWLSFEEIFKPALETVKRWDIDILISSFGCAPGERRADWFEDAISLMKRGDYRIKGFNIFAENKEGKGDYERDWSLDEATLKVLQRSLR